MFLVKDEKVDSVYSKFHIIPINFEFLLKLAIQGGEANEGIFLENHKNGQIYPLHDFFGFVPSMILQQFHYMALINHTQFQILIIKFINFVSIQQ